MSEITSTLVAKCTGAPPATRFMLAGIAAFVVALVLAQAASAGWTIQPTPNMPPAGAVSCRSASVCTAVGNVGRATLAERWNGTSWSTQPTPNPSNTGFFDDWLSGVSCAAAKACTAVGGELLGPLQHGFIPNSFATLAERWNGSKWSVQSSAAPSHTFTAPHNRVGFVVHQNSLDGVSCATRATCTAVGSRLTITALGSTGGPLVEHWNGAAWRTQRTPSLQRASLNAVSCPTPTSCIAVGGVMAERWNGSAWKVEPTPPGDNNLFAISCTATNACTAVGQDGNGQTLAERWNGTAWTIQAAPVPTGTTSSALSGVSCASASSCTAVGDYVNSSGNQLMLAERWNGLAWSIQHAPLPKGATSSALSGVSCASATTCAAVGHYVNPSGTELSLVEGYSR